MKIKLTHVPLDRSPLPKRELDFLRNAWFPLHSHNPQAWDESEAKAILAEVIAGLQTCGGCRQHAISYTTTNNPDFSTREGYHQYLWEFHNAVNKRISKPEFSWAEYKAKWLRWKQVEGQRIGVVSVNYEAMGGTETFHQTLVPRLANVIGFACLSELKGNPDLLGVPTGQGMESIISLSMQSDTVISWNIDWKELPRPKRLITVHHGSLSDVPSLQLCLQGDSIVAVNQDVAEHVRTLTSKPVTCIEPAVDPERIKPRRRCDWCPNKCETGKVFCSTQCEADYEENWRIKHLPWAMPEKVYITEPDSNQHFSQPLSPDVSQTRHTRSRQVGFANFPSDKVQPELYEAKKICLWSHRFHNDKRPQLAIEIAKHLPTDWHMVLTGHRGERLELNDRVTILPPQHPGDWLAVADCFLSTSKYDGFGLSVAEAITAGVPVVSSPVGIATRPGLALVVPLDAEPKEWAEAILASQSMTLPSRDLFGVEAFLTAWESVVNGPKTLRIFFRVRKSISSNILRKISKPYS